MSFNPVDLVRLHSGIKGMIPTTMRTILQTCVDMSTALSDIFVMDEAELVRYFPVVKPKVAQQLVQSTSELAEETLAELTAKGFRLITVFDDAYPQQLKVFDGSLPPLFYVCGNAELLQQTGIGFGGARNISDDGLLATEQLAQYVVRELQYTVISGHSKGVDVVAHQTALDAGGSTLLVLPDGALRFRLKKELRKYWSDAQDRIAIITQFAPNESWHVGNAMARNTTAICLSKAFCVIEAGDETGGTWQAGTTTLNKKLPLFVIDYPNPPQSAVGNTKLINKGGIPIPFADHMKLPPIDKPSTPPIQHKLF